MAQCSDRSEVQVEGGGREGVRSRAREGEWKVERQVFPGQQV